MSAEHCSHRGEKTGVVSRVRGQSAITHSEEARGAGVHQTGT